MTLLGCLDQICRIDRNGAGQDATGGLTYNWQVRLDNIPCSIWPATSKVVATYAALDSIAEFELITSSDIQCTTQDRVVINSKIYYVIGYQPYINASFSLETPYMTVLGKRNQP